MSITWISADDLGLALRRSRTLHRLEQKVIAGLNKAALELIGGATWSYDLTADELTISLGDQPRRQLRGDVPDLHVPGGSRGRVCWHSYARDLLVFAIQIGFDRTVAPKGILSLDDDAYADLLAKADELYG